MLPGNILPVAPQLGGMKLSDARKLKQLDDENRRLKRIVSDQALNKGERESENENARHDPPR